MPGPRDTQREKLYRAERAHSMYHVRPFDELLQVWSFLERVERDAWFKRHYGRWTFKVTDGRGRRRGRGGARGLRFDPSGSGAYRKHGEIALPRFTRFPLYIVHEVAHCLVSNAEPAHGRVYAATYLKLVRHFLGRAAHDELRAAFKANSVRWKPKRVLSDAQREQLRQRWLARRQQRVA